MTITILYTVNEIVQSFTVYMENILIFGLHAFQLCNIFLPHIHSPMGVDRQRWITFRLVINSNQISKMKLRKKQSVSCCWENMHGNVHVVKIVSAAYCGMLEYICVYVILSILQTCGSLQITGGAS